MGELPAIEVKYKIGIRVYKPVKETTWELIKSFALFEKQVTIGIWEFDHGSAHAFLIQDIEKVAKN